MEKILAGKKVAILVADGFEQVELTGPKEALEEAGAQTQIVSPNEESVAGWHHYDAGDLFAAQLHQILGTRFRPDHSYGSTGTQLPQPRHVEHALGIGSHDGLPVLRAWATPGTGFPTLQTGGEA